MASTPAFSVTFASLLEPPISSVELCTLNFEPRMVTSDRDESVMVDRSAFDQGLGTLRPRFEASSAIQLPKADAVTD